MEKKYELVPSDKEGLFRVKALRDFGDVKKGEVGGYVESERNLSHEGNCWIYDDAVVRGNAWVYCNARVYDNAMVFECASVFGDAVVRGNAKVRKNAMVHGDARVYENSMVSGNAVVCDHAVVYGNAVLCGDAGVCGYARVCGDAVVESIEDYLVFRNIWSSGRHFTWTRSNNMWKVGCFYGSGDELIQKAYADSELKGKMYESTVNYVKELLKNEKDL